MTRPLHTLTPLRRLVAPASALLLAASLAAPALADEAAPPAASSGVGPTSLFKESLMQQHAPQDRPVLQRERRHRDRQTTVPLDERDAVVRRAQSSLEQLGFGPGPVDGQMGPRTRSAIQAFQRERGQPADGRLSAALLRDLASALTEQRRVVAQQAEERPNRRSADREAPGELRSERNTVELVEGADTAPAERSSKAPPRGGLISTAEAATTAAAPPRTVGAAEAAGAPPGYMADGEYGLDDAVAESWAIFTGVSGAVLQLIEARVAELTDAELTD